MNFTIHPVQTAAELAAAIRIRHEVFVIGQNIPASENEDGNDPDCFHVLAKFNGKNVATGRLFFVDETTGTLSRIAVLESNRGLGIGKAMVKALEVIAVEQGLQYLSLTPHDYLYDFYVDLGYQLVAEKGVHFVEDHRLITMRKRISF